MIKILHSINYYYNKFNNCDKSKIKNIYKHILYNLYCNIDDINEGIKDESKLCIPIYYFDFDYKNKNEDEYMKYNDLRSDDEYYISLTNEYEIPENNNTIINEIDFENLNFRCKNCENCMLCMYCENCKNCTLCKFSSSLINCNNS